MPNILGRQLTSKDTQRSRASKDFSSNCIEVNITVQVQCTHVINELCVHADVYKVLKNAVLLTGAVVMLHF